jgi:hypothetical protein
MTVAVDDTTGPTITLDELHPGQLQVIGESSRYNVICCGRRWGKSLLGLDLAIETALDGRPVGWFAPTYKLLTEPWREAIRTLRPAIESKNEQEKQLRLSTGGVLDFWTLDDPNSGRGRKYARVVLDEAAMARHLEEAWTQAVRPTLTDYRGDAWFFSTPKGRNYFWRLHCLGMDPGEAEWAAWTMPTLTNPHISPEEVEAARLELPERVYLQEYNADFIDSSGGVFRMVREAVDAGRNAASPPQPDTHYVLGVDLARVEDFSVLAVLDATGRQVYHERFNQISWERQIARVSDVARRYHAPAIIDATGVGDPIVEALRRAGVAVRPFTFTAASKESAIDNLAIRIERGEVRLMDIAPQTSELLAYQYELSRGRNAKMNAPSGMHDDCVIALALAAWGLGQRREVRIYS